MTAAAEKQPSKLDRPVQRRLLKFIDNLVQGDQRVTLRTAAFTLACRRILEARHLRGLYP